MSPFGTGRANDVMLAVAEKYAICPAKILGKSRKAGIVKARHHAMWLCKVHLGWSYPQIGRAFNRTPSTAIHGVKKHEATR